MKALTLTQPWASLVALDAKRFETRGWATPERGPVAIHAGKNLAPVGGVKGLELLCGKEPFRTILAHAGLHADNLPCGVVVAVANLTDCVPTDVALMKMGRAQRIGGVQAATHEQRFGDYSEDRYVFALASVVTLKEHIPLRGLQKFWNLWDDMLTDDQAARLRRIEKEMES